MSLINHLSFNVAVTQTGTTAHAQRSGRSPVATDRDDRVILRTHRADRFTTVSHSSRVVVGT